MRRGGPQHPKVTGLAVALNIPRYAAVGLLECLWHYTAQYAPHGDLGRFDDRTIALGIGWDGDPETLVATLRSCRFLDPHPTYRLVVHHWNLHADQVTQRIVSRSGRNFVGGRKLTRKEASQKLGKNYPKIASGGKAKTLVEHCVKPEENNQDPTTLSQAANATSKEPATPAHDLIAEINRIAGTKYRPTTSHLGFARGRLREYAFDEIVAMLQWRWRTWAPEDRQRWFRPETLLNETKCGSYMGQYDARAPRVSRPVPREVTAIPDEKPERSAAAVARVRDIVGSLPWAK